MALCLFSFETNNHLYRRDDTGRQELRVCEFILGIGFRN